MSSYDYGKDFISGWIRGRHKDGATCLDVGAGDGKWFNLIGSFMTMDAVEIFQPNIDWNHLKEKYRQVWCADIDGFQYDWYDVIIFGDVIEHMDVEKAQRVIEYAKTRCSDLIIAVPFLYRQDEIYGNKWEKHLQEDLTPELFERRYPGLKTLLRPIPGYAYYVKGEQNA